MQGDMEFFKADKVFIRHTMDDVEKILLTKTRLTETD
jgi:hypothetical protein